MAMLIIFTIFGLFWLGTTLASITYMVFKNSRSLTRQLEEHPPFWLQDYYAFLNRYHKPLLIGSIAMGIGLTIWGINSQNKTHCSMETEDYGHRTTRIFIKRRGCQKRVRHERTYIERSAMPYGGMNAFYEHIQTYRYTPNTNLGTVYVQFFVQENGSLENISVLSGINRKIDNEAVRLVQSYEAGWQPALYHGEPVEQRVVIPIQF